MHTSIVSKQSQSPKDCSICLLKLFDGTKIYSHITKQGISHEFHDKCIKLWFQKKKSCPICKADLTPKSTKYIKIAANLLFIGSVAFTANTIARIIQNGNLLVILATTASLTLVQTIVETKKKHLAGGIMGVAATVIGAHYTPALTTATLTGLVYSLIKTPITKTNALILGLSTVASAAATKFV